MRTAASTPFARAYAMHGDELGEGSTAKVYAATSRVGPTKGTEVAVKVIDKTSFSVEELERLLAEASILKR